MALDVCLGVAAWLVWRRVDVAAHRKRAALRLWGWQVLAVGAWPSLFVGVRSPGLDLLASLLASLVLLSTAAATTFAFWPLQRRAAMLLLPGLGWTVFTTYLTFGLWWLNAV